MKICLFCGERGWLCDCAVSWSADDLNNLTTWALCELQAECADSNIQGWKNLHAAISIILTKREEQCR